MIKAEFHCHSCYSKDSLVSIQAMISTCRRKGIDRLVITDHNNIQGAVQAQKEDPGLFIAGEEIMTQQGELLGIFVSEEIPGGLTASEVIQRLRDQGAFISVSHPFDGFRTGHWLEPDLDMIIDHVDAIEVFNSRCMIPQFNTLAKKYAQAHKLAGTVGSDAHSSGEIGMAILTLPDFSDAATLRSALQHARQNVRLSSPLVHFHSRYAKWRKAANWKKGTTGEPCSYNQN